VVQWLEQEATEPFFALVHNVDLTNEPPEAGLERLRNLGIPKPPGQRMGMELLEQQAATRLAEAESQQLCIDTYDARLASYDQAIATMLAALEARGLRDRTVVILTSNHGQDLFEHGLVGHGSILYQSVLQVPLLVVDPTLEGRSGSIDAPVQGVDLAPYLLERAGIPASASMDGRSFMALLQDPEAPWPARPAVSVANRYGLALRQGDHKIVRHTLDPLHNGYKPMQGERPAWPPSTVTQLFDLAADPGEQRDLAGVEPEILATMQAELDGWAAFLEQRSGGSAPQDAPELQQALKDRGYWMHAQGDGEE
jgi:arylsulfatase A-like enzyme